MIILLIKITIENHFSKSSQLLNTIGNRKFNKLHNSLKLFYKGVPVNNNRYSAEYYYPSVYANLLRAFFILWPSSTTMYYSFI